MGALLKSKLVIGAAIVAALIGLYALLGFKVAPRIVRGKAIEYVREQYGRELTLGEIRIHPFKLQLEVRDAVFPDADGERMLAFKRLFVDFDAVLALEARVLFPRGRRGVAVRPRPGTPGRLDELRRPGAQSPAGRRRRRG